MGRIVVSQFVTVDGGVEDPGGSEGSPFGGWAFKFERGEEGDRFKLDEVMGADALLLGRVTYEGFAAAWPTREGDFADKFNGMPKYVASTTLADPEWNNTTVLAGDVAGEVAKLREAPGGDVLVNGSVTLLRTLVEHDLVDEYRLMVFPTVLGGGKRLFADGSEIPALDLVESRPVGDQGVLILIYRPKAKEETT
jgi:dihydrofolate reductase